MQPGLSVKVLAGESQVVGEFLPVAIGIFFGMVIIIALRTIRIELI